MLTNDLASACARAAVLGEGNSEDVDEDETTEPADEDDEPDDSDDDETTPPPPGGTPAPGSPSDETGA